MAASYHVTVGTFEGPFDLLLHLIARRKVDIYDIPIAQITDDYLAVVTELQELDLEVATEFLVVAATLIELKAARLLPAEDDPELEELALEARDLLYARLLDYRIFKEASSFLSERLGRFEMYIPRAVPLEEPFTTLLPEVKLGVDADQLAELAARALAERPDPAVDTSHLQPVRMTVREAAGMVMDELERAGGRATFRELTGGCRHSIEVIVHFLAILELYKWGHVDMDQAATFGDIVVATEEQVGWGDSSFAAMESYEGTDTDVTETGDTDGSASGHIEGDESEFTDGDGTDHTEVRSRD